MSSVIQGIASLADMRFLKEQIMIIYEWYQ